MLVVCRRQLYLEICPPIICMCKIVIGWGKSKMQKQLISMMLSVMLGAWDVTLVYAWIMIYYAYTCVEWLQYTHFQVHVSVWTDNI